MSFLLDFAFQLLNLYLVIKTSILVFYNWCGLKFVKCIISSYFCRPLGVPPGCGAPLAPPVGSALFFTFVLRKQMLSERRKCVLFGLLLSLPSLKILRQKHVASQCIYFQYNLLLSPRRTICSYFTYCKYMYTFTY